jgi:hypothetical protein
MTEIVAQLPGFRETERLIQNGPPDPAELLTNFERKARESGGSVWRASYVRVETAKELQG